MEAVEAIVKCYEVLVVYFEDRSQEDVTASGIVRQLKSYRFVVSLHFLLDVLTTLGQLNKTFQILAYHPCDACQKVAEVCEVLKDRYLTELFRWGPKAAQCIENIEARIGGVIVTEEEKTQLNKDCVDFVSKVVANLKSRFPHSNQGVVEAARIFDPGNLPKEDSLSNYGEAEIDLLSYHYSDFIDRNQCQLEWEILKRCMSSNFRTMKLQEFSLKLVVDEGLKIHYPFMSTSAEIILTYPASTAQVERGFSTQNLIKNKTRNRLGSSHLDQLIRMKLNAPKMEEFPFHESYLNWLSQKKRRFVCTVPETNFQSDDSDDSDDQ